VESFTTHKHLVLHAPRIGSDRTKSRVTLARQRIAPRVTTVLHRHPPGPAGLPRGPSRSRARARVGSPSPRASLGGAAHPRNASRVTVHTQNRYVLINVWTWCCAEASLPPIRLIVLQSFCRAARRSLHVRARRASTQTPANQWLRLYSPMIEPQRELFAFAVRGRHRLHGAVALFRLALAIEMRDAIRA